MTTDQMLEWLQLDVPPLLMLTFTSLICAISGNYVVLVRRSLMGDAVSHSVLPGIVLGFLLGGSLLSIWIVVGAVVSAMLGLLMMEVLQRYVGAEANASTGAVFTTMFALGVVMLELWVGTRVHLDVEHVLFGSLEQVLWLDVIRFEDIFLLETWKSFPDSVLWSGVWLFVLLLGLYGFGDVIVRVCFDGVQASLLGYHPRLVHIVLMMVLTVTAVLSFRAVGSILVIALFVCPAATARLVSVSVRTQVLFSMVFAIFVSFLGYILAVVVPLVSGYGSTFSVSGSVALLSFLLFVLTAFLRHFGVGMFGGVRMVV